MDMVPEESQENTLENDLSSSETIPESELAPGMGINQSFDKPSIGKTIIEDDYGSSNDQIENKNDELCCICLDFDCNSRLKCGHYFHKKCIINWI